MKNSAKSLDQFFTQDEVAKVCTDNIIEVIKKLGYKVQNVHFLEPSAGDGAFVRALKNKKLSFSAYDIDAKKTYIKKNDYLIQDISRELPERNITVVIGNPPFGKRANIAIDFINTSFKYSDTVAFILPLQFDKFSAQNRINLHANLVYNEKLDENSFLYEGKLYSVRCCLQVWTLKNRLTDQRLRQSPKINHPDFEMWQYNNTRQAEKYFDREKYTWNFAVPRQGYKNYSIKETNSDNMSRRTQWIFFKAKNKTIIHNLMKLDFEKLSHKNTSTPGFGKADVVKAYNEMFNQSILDISTDIQTFQLGEPKPSFAGTLPMLDTR